MRWMLWGCIALLSGCSLPGPTPPPVAVTILSGGLQEVGPEYEYNGGICGRVLNTREMHEQDQELWYTKNYNRVSEGATILVWHSARVRAMHDGGCFGPGTLYGFDDAGNLTIGVEGQKATQPVRREGDIVSFMGKQLLLGESASWDVHLAVMHEASESDERDGLYHYNGTLTLRHVGIWPAGNVHRVEKCDDLPDGC